MQNAKKPVVLMHSDIAWCDIKAAAAYLDMSVAFLRKLVRRNEIPFSRFGAKALRFRRVDLDLWAEARGYGVESKTIANCSQSDGGRQLSQIPRSTRAPELELVDARHDEASERSQILDPLVTNRPTDANWETDGKGR
jgi:excisionase family DNA binding protein